MKTNRILSATLILAMGLTSCSKLLDVTNPNYFTDD